MECCTFYWDRVTLIEDKQAFRHWNVHMKQYMCSVARMALYGSVLLLFMSFIILSELYWTNDGNVFGMSPRKWLRNVEI